MGGNGEEIKEREPCPICQKVKGHVTRNNLAIYSDGKYCMACGYREGKYVKPLIAGVFKGLDYRSIPLSICEKYNVRTTEITGELFNIFPVYKEGKVVKQKVKSIDNKKNQFITGATKDHNLFGMNLYSPTKKLPVLITEGEEDCLALAHMIGNLPVVSITSGASAAHTQLVNNLEWLSGWKEVILCFDNDTPGQDAVKDCVPIFEPGTVRSAVFPLKDANEMLTTGRIEEAKKAIVTAQTIKPATIVFAEELADQVAQKPLYGANWPFKFMDKVTFGCRLGEVYMLAADSSIGKTELMYTIVTYWLNNLCKVGLIDLERQNHQTIQRIIGGLINKRIYLPNCPDFDEEEIRKELAKLEGRLALYRPESGKLSLESICINIRYLNKGYGINYFVLDNLTALSSNEPGVKDYDFASYATGQLVQLSKELNVLIFIINHLVKDTVQLRAEVTEYDGSGVNSEGLSWETGRMPTVSNFYGGGKVTKLPDFVIALSRNRLSKDESIRRTLIVKFLKTRFDSTYEGHEFKLIYDPITGKLKEPFDPSGDDI